MGTKGMTKSTCSTYISALGRAGVYELLGCREPRGFSKRY